MGSNFETGDRETTATGRGGLRSSQSHDPSGSARENSCEPTAAPSTSKPHDHEEESIDQYMARLLDRVRSPSTPPPPKTAAEPRQAIGENAPDAPGPAVPAQPPAGTPRAAELTPRTVAPEKSIDLSAMRELANLSAKAAIERHARGLLARASGSKLFTALFSATCGGALYWMGRLHDNGGFALHAAAGSFVIALFWTLQYAVASGRLSVTRPDVASPEPPSAQPPKPPS
jgi:hypothetical protein